MSNIINKFFAASLTAVVLAGAATAIPTAPANAQTAGRTMKIVRPSNIEGLRLSGPAVGKAISPNTSTTTLRSAVIAERPMGMVGIGRRR